MEPLIGVNLLYERGVTLNGSDVAQRLRARLPRSELVPIGAAHSYRVIHRGHTVRLSDASGPAMTVVSEKVAMPKSDELQAAATQSWDLPGAAALVARCSSTVLVMEIMTSTLAAADRMLLVTEVVRACAENAPPALLLFRTAGKLVSAAALDEPAWRNCVNVRMFKTDSGDIVMDTLGLVPLGLPDVQIRYRGYDPGQVAGRLYGWAHYLLENGDILSAGNTVEGINAGEKWRCRRAESLVGPPRPVVDLDPSPKKSFFDRLRGR